MVKLVEFLNITEAKVSRAQVIGPLGDAGWWNAKVKKGISLDWGEESHSLKAAKHPQAFGTQRNLDVGVKHYGSAEEMAYQEEGMHNSSLMLSAYAKGWVRWLTFPDKETGEGELIVSGRYQDVYDFLKSSAGRSAAKAYGARHFQFDIMIQQDFYPVSGVSFRDSIDKLHWLGTDFGIIPDPNQPSHDAAGTSSEPS